MKCGYTFKKGDLNIRPAKIITCKHCNYRGHIAKNCNLRNMRPSVKVVNDNHVNTENCTYV